MRIALCDFANASVQQNLQPLDTVTLQLKWYHQFQFAGFYAAAEKGIYSEYGLYVKILEGYPGIQTTEEVLNGKADFGTQTSNILIDRAKGEDVVVLAAIFQHSPLVLITQPLDKYNNPQGLVNKRIMLRGDSDAELLAMLINEHVDNYTSVNHEWGLDAFINKDIDALSCYLTDQPYDLDKKALKYNILRPISYGIDFYGDCIFSSGEFVDNHPELVEKFLAASKLGWEYAMANKTEIANMIIEKYSSKNDFDVLIYEAEAMDKLILPELIPVGAMNQGRWRHIMKTYQELGLIENEVELDDFIYNPELKRIIFTQRILFLLGILVAISLFGLAVLMIFNKRLSSKVNKRTIELRQLNSELQKNIEHTNEINSMLENALCKASESEQLKAAFIQNISHEIRTPLNAIIGFSNLIINKQTEEKNMGEIETAIAYNTEILLKIVDDIIEISNIDINDVEQQLENCDINELCKEIESLNKHKVNNQTHFSFDECLVNETFIIDKLRVRQVLNNLLSNAFKFTKSGEIKFGYNLMDSNSHLHFYVSDTGIGIHEKDFAKIFKSFTKLDSFKRGVGLGLYICKILVEKMEGQIWVESEPDKGSVFHFSVKSIG